MAALNFTSSNSIANVFSVDTGIVFAKVNDLDELRRLQVNQLIAIQSSKAGQLQIGLINKITRKAIDLDTSLDDEIEETDISLLNSENLIKVTLIGTLFDAIGTQTDVFKRTIDSVPEIYAECYPMRGSNITSFMSTISRTATEAEKPLNIGSYSIDENADAYLDGDKLFQRHAVVVGSTGSGKSWCVARLVEQIADLDNPNCILFDIHGEYSTDDFKKDGISHFRIANPSDLEKEQKLSNNILMLPYWLLTYEEMLAMLLDRSDNNAPNQAMLFSRAVNENKRDFLEKNSEDEILGSFTIDSPVPYDLDKVIEELENKDTERVDGSRGKKNGPYHGKLTRFIQRLQAKQQDKRLGFLFDVNDDELRMKWLEEFCNSLMKGDQNSGVKVIDFSEVPSDILPLIISLVARIIFSVQQWTKGENRHPISLFCDEAHLYIPEKNVTDSISQIGLNTFERIAKEGRKYGVGLIVISQRPSEVNKTVMSQCNNFISLRLTNVEDQSVIKRLLPDNLSGLTDVMPILDIGEALVVGDASLLPTRINIAEPEIKPSSATVNFWQEWGSDEITQDLENAIKNLRLQSK